ncbi:peptidoglycan recognition protein [Streptomyces sp. BHT-5-2]|uniref:peptidoglycan recognition protein family protein n=1 Tax=unclassified Streptomyces TaxID=2593676 RepID=UPI001C8E0B16|nr:peptidoglycan recognition protein [Streptomyces sp. BHT-5-2]QZL02289.1 peptidoglycan recognition protein [Streptomyces sp. BHT-5-2]
MRPILATCLGAACTAALALPLAPPAHPAETAAGPGTASAGDLPGATQSLPLDGLGPTGPHGTARATVPPQENTVHELPPRAVRPFSLVGVVWDDAATALRGRAQVRTRARGSARWSDWQDLQTDSDDAPDPGGEPQGTRARGSTAPLWVGASDAIQLRLTVADPHRAAGALPHGLRLELVDPGPDTPAVRGGPPPTPAAVAGAGANAPLAPPGATEIPAADQVAAQADIAAAGGHAPVGPAHIGARPRIVTRVGWGADERLREARLVYTHTVRAAFVHHSATGNNYTCAQAPSVIRGLYRYHVKSSHWRDIGYNFLIDKCGTVYEGRAGGVAKPVLGAHTLGFNNDSTGIALLGSFNKAAPSRAAVESLARLTAWKLGLYGADPRGRAPMTSSGGNLYRRGKTVQQHVISGHRDGFKTECPGTRLYADLPAVRLAAAHLQGR